MNLKSPLLKRNTKERHLEAFLIALAVACVIFVPFIIRDRGYFLYFGDYNVQQIPFLTLTHSAVRSGNIFWSWFTDLGANLIGSYTYHDLTSPFFWAMLPFPTWFVPYLIGPFLIIKFALSSLFAYMFLRRFVKNKDFALIGALLYAFSGYAVYGVFFAYFEECVMLFPLLLWGLEELMEKDRKGVFALVVFLNCFTNYFFFVGEVVFVIIYFFIRLYSNAWEIDLKKLGLLALEAILGFGITMIMVLPALAVTASNPRTGGMLSGWGAVMYGSEQRYGAILHSFFFPPDIPARPNFFPEANAKWSSLGAWLPLFSMTGVIAYLRTKKNDWLKKIIYVLFVMAFIPVLNSFFYLLNGSFYMRWLYMFVLMTALATIMALEDKKTDWTKAQRLNAGITGAFILLIGLTPKFSDSMNYFGEFIAAPSFAALADFTNKFGVFQYADRFWIYCLIAVVSIVIVSFLIPILKKDIKIFSVYTVAFVCVISAGYSLYHISLGKSHSDDTHNFLIPYSLNMGKDFTLEDTKTVRVDTTSNGLDNQAMFWGMPTIQAFHSLVPRSIMEFYPEVGVTRDVGSRAESKFKGLRALHSVKYLFYEDAKGEEYTENSAFEYLDTQNGFKIYENKHFIPFGFTYDYFCDGEMFEKTEKEKRDRLLVKAIYLNEQQIERHSDILEPLNYNTLEVNDDEALYADADDRAKTAASYFDWDNTGFTAAIALEKENLVFFSVPYEEGWSATVNGEKVKIEKVSIGFMAVRCPKGTNEIRFNYMTPYLKLGVIITLVCLVLFLAYIIYFTKFHKKKAADSGIVEVMEKENLLDSLTDEVVRSMLGYNSEE